MDAKLPTIAKDFTTAKKLHPVEPKGVFPKCSRTFMNSVFSVNSENLINHWSMNWDQFKDLLHKGGRFELFYWQLLFSLNSLNSVLTLRENSYAYPTELAWRVLGSLRLWMLRALLILSESSKSTTRKPVGFMQSCCHPMRTTCTLLDDVWMTCRWCADDICHLPVKSCQKSCSHGIRTSSAHRPHIVCTSSARDFNPKNISS